MRRESMRWIAVACVVAVSVHGNFALADGVTVGCDPFATPEGGASLDFGGGFPSVPAGFFGPGSDLFTGLVSLKGAPLGMYNGSPTGNADTVVERLQTANLPNVGDNDTIPIELVALSLKSVDPMPVTFNGGQNLTEFDVFVEQSPISNSIGSMTINHETADGGTWSSDMAVFVKVTFTEVGNPGNQLSFEPGVSDSLVCSVSSPGEWSHTDPPGGVADPCNPNSNFFVTVPCIHVGPHPDTLIAGIPTVSEWGLIVLTLLGMAAGTVMLGRRRLSTHYA